MGFLVGEISAGIGSLKAAVDIAKGIHALNTSTEVRQKTSDLLDALLEARMKLIEAADTQTALLRRIDELEQRIAGFEDWDSDMARYQLTAIDARAFAYTHKAGMQGTEPAIWLCQPCFEKRRRSVLQFRAQDRGPGAAGGRGTHSRWGCDVCKSEVVVPYQVKPA